MSSKTFNVRNVEVGKTYYFVSLDAGIITPRRVLHIKHMEKIGGNIDRIVGLYGMYEEDLVEVSTSTYQLQELMTDKNLMAVPFDDVKEIVGEEAVFQYELSKDFTALVTEWLDAL